MFGKIYHAIRQISSAFLGEGKTIFKQVVLFEYPRKGIYSIGFVTGKASGAVQTKSGEEMITVFLPTTPNPTSGIFLLVPKSELRFLKMSVEEGMKMHGLVGSGRGARSLGGHSLAEGLDVEPAQLFRPVETLGRVPAAHGRT